MSKHLLCLVVLCSAAVAVSARAHRLVRSVRGSDLFCEPLGVTATAWVGGSPHQSVGL